jgi:hypothetical protein
MKHAVAYRVFHCLGPLIQKNPRDERGGVIEEAS